MGRTVYNHLNDISTKTDGAREAVESIGSVGKELLKSETHVRLWICGAVNLAQDVDGIAPL